MRAIQQNEINAYHAFAIENNLLLEGAEGERNAEILGNVVVAQWNKEITAQTLQEAMSHDVIRKEMKFKSTAQTAFDQAYNVLSQDQKELFGRFWNAPSTQRALLTDGDDGFHNGAALLTGMRGHPWNYDSLVYVMQRVGNSGGLRYQPVKTDRVQGQYSGREIPDVKANRSHAEVLRDNLPESLKPKAEPATDWAARSEAAGHAANTGTGRAKLQAVLVMNADGTVDHRATALAREKMSIDRASGGF